jgi:PEP-CTERM motif-containing protein
MNFRAKFLFLIGLLGPLCLMLPDSLQADTTYSYQSSPYTTCFGTYTCSGTALSITFNTSLTGTSLDNLNQANITPTITSFTMTDGNGVDINMVNATPGVSFVIDTNSSGQITQWSINAAIDKRTGLTTGELIGAESCNDASDGTLASSGACSFIPIQNGLNLGDFSFFNFGTDGVSASGGRSLVPQAWSAPVPTPEPSSFLLLSGGLLGVILRRLKK